MNLTQYEVERRRAEIPRIISNLALQRPLLMRVLDMFVSGSIVTKEECYCQMIIALASCNDEQHAMLMRHFQCNPIMPYPPQR